MEVRAPAGLFSLVPFTMGRTNALLLLLLVLVDNSFRPTYASCKVGCTGQNKNVLKLQEGTTYVYNLESDTQTGIAKTATDDVSLKLRAKVEVNVQPQCSALIKLQSVQIIGPDEKKLGSLSKLEANPLRVSLNSGTLSPDACAVPEDDYTSLNIKRAVASLLQLNSAEVGFSQEVDVFGSCPTEYTSKKEGDVTVISKSRDLSRCSGRENIQNSIFSIPNAGDSILQATPLLEPKYDAEIRVKGGVIQSAKISESYLFRPFSDKGNGAKAKITTKLTLETTSAGNIPDTTKEPRSIIFENPHEGVSVNIQTVNAALHKAVDGLNVAANINSARNFADLVSLVRRASAEDLLSIYGQVKAGAGFKNKESAKKMYNQALSQAGSADSIAVTIELLKSRELSSSGGAYERLSFARHVSVTTLEKALSILEEITLPPKGYLGIGSLVGIYCRQHSCENVPIVDKILSKLAEPLANAIPANRGEENKNIALLKALRNAKGLNEDAANKVIGVIKETKSTNRLRSAALDTALSDSCKKQLQKAAVDVLGDREEDSELRIKAYLILVECPTAKTANKLSEFLENEPSYQVGSFITSHLRNLRATANPDRQLARSLLQNVKPRNNYPIDIRKFSSNLEASYDIDALGASASAESNIIYSQKSYIPRSANLNLTAEVFGHNLNLLEITARAENVERILERLVGPKGSLREKKGFQLYKEIIDDLRDLTKYGKEKADKLRRSRRSPTLNDINAFKGQVEKDTTQLDDEAHVDVGIKLFSNEIFWNFLDESRPASAKDIIDLVAEIVETNLGLGREFDNRAQSNNLFLDAELAYPTSSGLPVKLSATGTSVVDLKLAGQSDIASILKDPKNGKLRLELRPSASVEVIGKLTINAGVIESGVKIATTLHTATGTDITVQLLDGQGIDLQIGLPLKESDILTVNTELLTTVRPKEEAETTTLLKLNVPRKDFHGCFDQLQPIIGLTLCGDVGFPNDPNSLTSGAALYPLNGHSKISLKLQKEDENLKYYHFRFQFNLKDPQHRRIEALIDTPGSTTPRELGLLVEAKTVPNKEINIKLRSPIYSFLTSAKIIESDSEYTLTGLAELEGAFTYKARLGLLINGPTYTPILELTNADGSIAQIVNVEGTVTVDKSSPPARKYTFNNVRVSNQQGTISVDGTIVKDTNLFQTDLKVGYDQGTVGIKTKLQRQGDNNLKIVAEITPSQYADFGFGIKYEYQRDKTHVENSLAVTHGRDLTNKDSRISIFQQVTYNVESVQRFDISTKNTITYPLFGLEGKLEGHATQKSFNYDLLLAYEQNSISSKLTAKTGISKPGDYEIDFSAAALNHGLTLELKRDIVGPNKSKFQNTLVLTPGGKYTANAEVTHQILDKSNVDARLLLIVTLEGVPEPYKLDFGAIVNPAALEAHSKFSVGTNDLLDAELKQTRTVPQSGSFRFNLRKALESNGEYKRAGEKATATFVINILPITRKIKGAADLTIAGTKHAGSITILYDAEKDPSRKILIQTDNDITSKSIKSKNKLEESGREVLINFNGEVSGKPGNGGVSGGFEVTLPTGQHLVGRSKHVLNIIPSNSNGEVFLELGYSPAKGSALTKITLDHTAKNIDPKRYAIDSNTKLTFICESGDVSYTQSIRSAPKEGKLVIELQNALGGSRLGEYQYNGKTKLSVNRNEVDYQVSANLGQTYSLNAQGKLQPGLEDKVINLEQTITAKTPAETLSNLKLVSLLRIIPGDETKPCQLKVNQEVVINEKNYKLSAEGGGTKHDLSYKGSLVIANLEPYTAQITYKHIHGDELEKCIATLDAAQGSKIVKLNLNLDHNRDNSLVNVKLTGSTPLESAKTIDITLGLKNSGVETASTDLKAVVNDNTLDLKGKYILSQTQTLLDYGGTYNKQKFRYYIKWEPKGARSFHCESQVAWPHNGGGQSDSSVTADLENLDNFGISVKIHSEKLQINKYKIEVGNKPTKGGQAKRVSFNAQNADGKIFSGSATYAVKEDEYGFSVEGKGQMNVKGENKPLTYKIAYTRKSGDEIGFIADAVCDFGKGNYNSAIRLTNKQTSIVQKYAWGDKYTDSDYHVKFQTNADPKSKTEVVFKSKSNFFGPPIDHDYALVAYSRQEGLFFNTDGSLTIKDTKYAFRKYLQKNEAGIVLDVPTREIAAIAQYQAPNFKNTHIEAKIDASLYLDRKKNPTDRASLVLQATSDDKDNSVVTKVVAKFNHPSIRELSVKHEGSLSKGAIKGTLEVDVFAKKGQKIAASYGVEYEAIDSGRNVSAQVQLISKSLVVDLGAGAHAFASRTAVSAGSFAYFVDEKNVKKEVGASVSLSTKKAATLVKVPGYNLVEGEFRYNPSGNVKTLDGELTIADGETGVLNAQIVGIEKIEVIISPKSNPNRKLIGLASLNKEKAEIRAERVDGGNKETLFYTVASISKDDLVKLDYDFQAENIKKTAKYFEDLGQDTLTRIRNIADTLSKDVRAELKNLAEAVKKAQPNLKPLLEKYQNTFKAIRQEIENDKNFKELAGVIKRVVGGVLEISEAYINTIVNYYGLLQSEIAELQSNIVSAYEKISPDITAALKKLVDVYVDVAKNLLKIANELLTQVLDIIKAHEKDVKLVLGNVAESFQDVGKVVIRNVRQFQQEVQDFSQLLLDQLKSLPVVENAKERIRELINFEIPPHFWELYEELVVSVTDVMPTPELKELAERIFKYIEKRLKRENVDDVEELAAISKQAAGVANKLLQEFKDYYGIKNEDIPVFGYSLQIPFPAIAVLKLPELGNIKFSPLSLLANAADLPNPLDLLYTYRPTTNPLPPFRAYGIIVSSHHLITFDKKHYSFKGSCSYVLAQDVVDGNFSIIANLENGKIKSLTIADKTDVVDLLADNTVVVNGKPGDYPVSANDIVGWRRYNSVNIKIKGSVFITKYIPQDIYVIRVSGFYFARTRGLLGTINYEQYDEFTLPNGHLAKTSAELVNAYKLSSCPAVPESSHTAPHAAECTAIFTSDSPLRAYFRILSPAPFREACDQHVAMMPSAALKAACEIAAAFVAALKQEDTLLPTIPPECAQCTVNGKKLELGQSEEVQIPSGKADVVLVVEQSTHNAGVFKDLVTPLITSLTADLKEKGLGDVEYVLIGYGGPKQKWPVHYGSKGKITYEGNSEGVKFGDRDDDIETYGDKFLDVLVKIKKIIDAELGNEQLVIAMNEANRYPFREGTTKIIVLVNSSPCVRSPLFPISLQLPRTLGIYNYYRQHDLNFFLVSPLRSISVNSPDGKDKSIVGFDSGKIYKISDAKKKPLEGDATDRDRLNYQSDICIDYSQFYGGAAFSSQNLLDAKPEQKKKFVQVVSQRIAQGAVEKKITEDCTCTLKNGFIPVTECTRS